MGHQVIKQPDGLYAVFSSGTDQWIMWDFTREELIEHYVQRAAEVARKDTAELLDMVDDNPREAYAQFAMTFEEANADSVESGGEDLSAKLTVQEAAATADIGPARLSADLTMSNGRTVHVPVVPTPQEPASAGRVKVEIPWPASAMPGLVAAWAIANEELGMRASNVMYSPAHMQAGDTLTVEFGEESIDAGDIARVFGKGQGGTDGEA